MSTYTEDHLVEQPAIQLMQHELGWEVVNCYDEWNGGVSRREGWEEGESEHRTPSIEQRSEEKWKTWTNPVLPRLNPDLPVEAIEGAVEEICRDRTALILAAAISSLSTTTASARCSPSLPSSGSSARVSCATSASRWETPALPMIFPLWKKPPPTPIR